MRKRDISRILNPGLAESLSEIAERYGLHNRKNDSLIRSTSYREDERRLRAFARFNRKKIAKIDENAISFVPPGEDADINGEILLGHDFYFGKPVGIKLSELTRPFAVFGATGFFKSITLCNIAVQLIKKGIVVILIDRKGRQFRSLQKAYPDNVLVMRTNGEFPYSPYWNVPLDFLARVVETRSAVFQRHDSSNIFLEVLLAEARKYAPCEHDIHNALVQMKFKRGFSDMRRLLSSLLSVSTGLLNCSFGNTFAYRKGIDIKEMIKQKISLVVESLNSDFVHLELLISELLNEIQHHLRSEELKHDELKVVFLIDEGTEIMRDRKEIPPAVEASTKIRQAGMGFGTGVHAPHLCHSLFRANIHVMCCYRLESGESVETIRDSYFLDKEQAAYIPEQPLGQGFAILGDRYPKPLAYVSLPPLFEYDLNIPNEIIEAGNKEIMKKLPEIEPWKGEILTVIEEDDDFDLISIKVGSDEGSGSGKEMAEKEKTFLDYILHRFDLPVTEIYKELGFSMEEGNQVSNSVIKKNLAVDIRLNPSGKQGGLCKFLVHSEKYYLLTGNEKPITGTDAKGAEHFLMLRFALKNLKEVKNCDEIKVSRAFENAVCDIFFRHKGLAYIAEICCSTQKTERRKIESILDNSDVDTAFVIVKERLEVDEVRKEFAGSEIEERVRVCAFSEFLNSEIETLTGKNEGV